MSEKPPVNMSLRQAYVMLAILVIVGIVSAILFVMSAPAAPRAVPVNLPDRARVPGWGNRFVTQATLSTTVCVVGYTATIRPPSSYTAFLKTDQLKWQALPGTTADYEEDHFIPLELGGSPYDSRNLWPESWTGANRSDPLENQLHAKLCSGALTLRQAQQQIIAFKRANG